MFDDFVHHDVMTDRGTIHAVVGGDGPPPLLVLWGAHGALPSLYDDVLAIWRDWASDVRGEVLDASHYIPEDMPEQTAALLRGFFAG